MDWNLNEKHLVRDPGNVGGIDPWLGWDMGMAGPFAPSCWDVCNEMTRKDMSMCLVHVIYDLYIEEM